MKPVPGNSDSGTRQHPELRSVVAADIRRLHLTHRQAVTAGIVTAVLGVGVFVFVHVVPGMLLSILVLVFFRWARIAAHEARTMFYKHREVVCLDCGYDCASLDIRIQPVCPECGTVRGAYVDPKLLRAQWN